MSKIVSRVSKYMSDAQKSLARDFGVYNRIEISHSAVLNNYEVIKRASGGLDVMPVLKANAYGHDIEIYSNILKKVRMNYLVVDGYFEAERIWKVSDQPVLIMGAIDPNNFVNLPHKNVAYFIQDEAGVKAMGKTGRPFVVHLECDTGMKRYGVSRDELPKVLQQLKKYPNVKLEGVATHFADADDPKSDFLEEQLDKFEQRLKEIRDFGFAPTIIHAANTAAAARTRRNFLTAVRTGIAIHGVSTLTKGPDANKYDQLKPSMRIISTITKTRKLKKGETVSYSRTFVAKKDMEVGVLPMGYYEAIPRDLSNKGVVEFAGLQLPIVGRVCMNHTIVDITGKNVEVGDEVVVIDNDSTKPNSFSGWHKNYNLHPHLTMTNISSTIRRQIVD